MVKYYRLGLRTINSTYYVRIDIHIPNVAGHNVHRTPATRPPDLEAVVAIKNELFGGPTRSEWPDPLHPD